MTHLGYYPNPREGELVTRRSRQVDGIDFIAAAIRTPHAKTVAVKQPSGGSTIIFQVGKSGIYLGRVDLKMRDGKVTASAGCFSICAMWLWCSISPTRSMPWSLVGALADGTALAAQVVLIPEIDPRGRPSGDRSPHPTRVVST